MRHALVVSLLLAAVAPAGAETRLRIMPPDGAALAMGQRFDLLVEATGSPGARPDGLTVRLDGADVTARNEQRRGEGMPDHVAAFLLRDVTLDQPGAHRVEARTADGATATVTLQVFPWQGPPAARRVKNVIFFLGDGMGLAHRTAARLVSRGIANGKSGRLAMDTMEVTGLVATSALNAVITDSAPGMSAYVTGQKGNNNQEGVYPDTTPDAFDNPRAEYLGALLRRVRGPGFNVGIVTTADVTDATPAANAVHTSDRGAGPAIAARFLDERKRNGVTVLMGGGQRHFVPAGRPDGRDLASEFRAAGFTLVGSRRDLLRLADRDNPPKAVLGLFHPTHMNVAFDKRGAGTYSRELARPIYDDSVRDQPMLEDMTRVALRTLERHSPDGFYLMVEGASIDKQSHQADAERAIWDVIEMDRAVAVALEFAKRTNGDADPGNDTLVVVTADHECGGLAIVAVGNERYQPKALGTAVRDYAAVFRFQPEQVLNFETNYQADGDGYPIDPDPSRKLLLGWAAAPDRYENWISNREVREPSLLLATDEDGRAISPTAVANPARDGSARDSDNQTVDGKPIPGFRTRGVIENGARGCPAEGACPADTAAVPHTFSGHTATDVPLSASGPGAHLFTGTYDNTDVFRKLLEVLGGTARLDR